MSQHERSPATGVSLAGMLSRYMTGGRSSATEMAKKINSAIREIQNNSRTVLIESIRTYIALVIKLFVNNRFAPLTKWDLVEQLKRQLIGRFDDTSLRYALFVGWSIGLICLRPPTRISLNTDYFLPRRHPRGPKQVMG
uniref:V-type ATP synthase beta chain n=1 Tax=Lygus hesperus TaxID=30085 RepID=A0A0A9Y816_LYGHE